MNSPAKIIIAPDSFKGTANADQAAQWLAEGVQEVLDCEIVLAPMADGGEGTAARFTGVDVTLPTTDALGRLIEASYRFDESTATAYIDVAAASGITLIDAPRPLIADTYGTGVLIADAQTRGARTIVLGLGGTATVDGGSGILVALGANLLDAQGHTIAQGGGGLAHLDHIDTAMLNIPAASVQWVLLSDVDNPATGPEGAAAVFGPQKGASPQDVEKLDAGLARLCQVTGVDPTTPGMGAAGGLAIGITWLSALLHGQPQVQLLPGAKVIASAAGLEDMEADLIISGEGRFDAQSLHGKVVGTVLEMAGTTPVAIVAGRHDAEANAWQITLGEGEPETQLREAGREVAQRFASMFKNQG
ncbi:glycerate kinase [Corynebacterium pseudopelargi]|uniref:Glycerate 2-kinase n=1 Tax=Corynebacterium pseudopelargi TaxID=2080757 RepID=A0A3G6IWE2_9CORY|nr:glycerate kinase [Corynebacterium pseudopelargi]AZA08978.1 Glycerate 2-kinase [Corynebacterium pseudopelargi]